MLQGRFGDRFKTRPQSGPDTPMAVVSPVNASEVEFLAEVAYQQEAPLVAVGAGAAPEAKVSGAVLVRFDLMRRVSIGDGPGDPVEVEPSVPWIHLEDYLRGSGASLKVYPTSAPRSTVGGWLALDGMGVGSYEFGRLSENVVSLDVVEPGGVRRRIGSRELGKLGEGKPLIVGAALETRAATSDIPFAAGFDGPEDLAETVRELVFRDVPLWHLGFINAVMAKAEGHEDDGYVLFGAYPAERASLVEAPLWETVASYGGGRLPAAEAYRIWGSRFYPGGPTGEVPRPGSVLVPREELGRILKQLRIRLGAVALQGSVSRTDDVLLLAFGDEEGRISELGHERRSVLLGLARERGGRAYRIESTETFTQQ